ncbi:hypothetical protein STEG23_011319 [Scotinomys teguina]
MPQASQPAASQPDARSNGSMMPSERKAFITDENSHAAIENLLLLSFIKLSVLQRNVNCKIRTVLFTFCNPEPAEEVLSVLSAAHPGDAKLCSALLPSQLCTSSVRVEEDPPPSRHTHNFYFSCANKSPWNNGKELEDFETYLTKSESDFSFIGEYTLHVVQRTQKAMQQKCADIEREVTCILFYHLLHPGPLYPDEVESARYREGERRKAEASAIFEVRLYAALYISLCL